MNDSFLAIDIGNSSTKAARFNGASWGKRIVIPRVEDVRAGLKPFLEEKIPCGIASVVPKQTDVIREICPEPPFVVGTDSSLPFALAYGTPQTLGADRLAAAAGAWFLYGQPENRPILALTAGTTLTLTAVDVQNGEPVLLGGAILPGPDLLRRVLSQGTAQLPFVNLEDVPPAIGTTTEESIQIGIDASLFDAATAVITRTADSLSARPIVVATGGWASQLSERTGLVDFVDSNLVFEGIRRLTLLNQTVGNAKNSSSSATGSRPATV